MAERWIQGAIRHKGSLRRTAKRAGLIEGREKLSLDDLAKLRAKAKATGNTTLGRRVSLARTLRRF